MPSVPSGYSVTSPVFQGWLSRKRPESPDELAKRQALTCYHKAEFYEAKAEDLIEKGLDTGAVDYLEAEAMREEAVEAANKLRAVAQTAQINGILSTYLKDSERLHQRIQDIDNPPTLAERFRRLRRRITG
jgi:hypothetical protein